MIIKKITMFVVMMAAAVIIAAPTVTDVTAKQRYPWNRLVDITCKVTGIEGTTNGIYYFSSVAAVPEARSAIKGSQFWVMQNGVKTTDRRVSTNGNYRLLWDAQADLEGYLGHVIHSNMVVRVTLRSHGKVQLWEGGPYWAETNIGADEPWEYGYFFWWGDIVGYRYDEDNADSCWVASDGSSSNFSFEEGNAPTYNKSISALQSEGWITADGVLAPAHDAAHVHWGGGWRMPTKQEISDLESKCDWTLKTMNGVRGYVVKGKGVYASASIFLPCAGIDRGPHHPSVLIGSYGRYWSSVPFSDDQGYAWNLRFSYSAKGSTGHSNRYGGLPVRPVQGFTE